MEATDIAMQPKAATGKAKWLKRVGIWGFLFFLVKGLLWLGIAAWGWRMAN